MTRQHDKRRFVGVAAAAALLATGCASSQWKAQELAASRQIERAEESGVPAAALRGPERNLEFAEDAEERAVEDRETAIEDLERAREREFEARRLLAERENELAQVTVDLSAAQGALTPAELDYSALRDRGLTIAEAETLSGPRLQLLRQRVESLRQARRTLERQVQVARLEAHSAESYASAAETLLESAVQRLELAGALYDLAREQATTLELERLTAEQQRVNERLQTMP